MQEELPQPLYFSFHGMTSFLKMTAPKYVEVSFGGKVYRQIVSALRRAGYHTSQCHCDPLALKTDAPAMWCLTFSGPISARSSCRRTRNGRRASRRAS